jgi:hypothetical protein
MKRIIAVIALALAITVLSAASALACVVGVGVYAPNGGHGPVGNHLITCLPVNQGTVNAADNTPSPAVNFSGQCGGF